MSHPAMTAILAASLLSLPIPCRAISPMEPQSLTVKPLNPHFLLIAHFEDICGQ